MSENCGEFASFAESRSKQFGYLLDQAVRSQERIIFLCYKVVEGAADSVIEA